MLNGICFEVDSRSFGALTDREQIYQMHEVTVHRYNDDGPLQMAKLFWAKDHESFRFLKGSDAQKHYLKLCLGGCAGFGSRFLNDFKKSTVFWDVASENEIDRIWRGDY